MNRNQVALFKAVAEAGGFSKAAEKIRISQPALSMQVAELEEQLGALLLERLPRGVRTTQAGSLLLDYAQRLARLEEEAERALRELRGLSRGQITIGASTTVGMYLVPEILGQYRMRYPAIDLHLEIANTELIEKRLIEGTLDLGLTEGGPPESQQLAADIFRDDELVAIAPPGHPIFAEPQITIARFCAEPMIAREPGSGTRDVIERFLGRRKIKLKPAALTLTNTETIKRSVAAGLGLAIVSRYTIELELATERLAVVPLVDCRLSRPLYLLRPRLRHLSAAGQAFCDVLGTGKVGRGR